MGVASSVSPAERKPLGKHPTTAQAQLGSRNKLKREIELPNGKIEIPTSIFQVEISIQLFSHQKKQEMAT